MSAVSVRRRFADALRARLDGRAEDLLAGANGQCTPAWALQAGVETGAVLASAAEAVGIDHRDRLDDRPVSAAFVEAVPIGFARRHGIVALDAGDGTLALAAADLPACRHADVIARLLSRRVECVLAPREEILRTINLAYQQADGGGAVWNVEADGDGEPTGASPDAEDLLDGEHRTDVVRLVNAALLEAVRRRASDVHVQPEAERLAIRLRIDGVLQDVHDPPVALAPEILSRIKVMGGMDIAERRLAQDGRATVEVGERRVDLRISTLPTSFGERAVIRLLDKSLRLLRLEQLGMPPDVLDRFGRLIHQDHGMILVTGPTGSGKTTTLYAALQEIDAVERNVLTLEDPIEYRLDGVSQTQVNRAKGMDFPTALRHVLRQDPDIIMVGEIRDAETARMAIQSALTGHLVFSTLHTNDAPGAVTRMLDLGVEPYLLASSLLGVMAQRLVRKICPHCRRSAEVGRAEREAWGLDATGEVRLSWGAGCEACLHKGYLGREGIFELLTVTEPIRERIGRRAKASSIKDLARADGMRSLREAGRAKALDGVTTAEEVARVTSQEEY